jgi:mannose-6-phosphate isomerase-like protein (cupin superfamily)
MRPGEIYENPVTGERAVVVECSEDGAGDRLVAELTVRPGGAVVGEHIHPAITETFEVRSGRMGVRQDGRELVAAPGERFVVAPGHPHDWWNAGDDDVEVLVTIEPSARFEQMILTMFGLARRGETDDKGMPHPLQLAVIAREFDDTIRFTSPPRPIQRVITGVLGPLGRLLGRRPILDYGEPELDPRWAAPDREPAPA